MSYNRLSYDTCTYSRELSENVNILKYVINEDRYEHPQKCFHGKGLLGGATVSKIRGDVVDLESELRGITRNLSKCAISKAKPLEDEFMILNDKTVPLDTRNPPLPACQMIDYKTLQTPNPQNFNQC
jgi:hypothetical protein